MLHTYFRIALSTILNPLKFLCNLCKVLIENWVRFFILTLRGDRSKHSDVSEIERVVRVE